MFITTKGRNALKVMIDLAEHDDGSNIALSDISERIGESQKYLEVTVAALVNAGLIRSARGKAGGYKLAKRAEEYTVAEIICAGEGSLSPVSCLDNGCDRADCCPTLPLWRELDETIMNFLRSKSLKSLLK